MSFALQRGSPVKIYTVPWAGKKRYEIRWKFAGKIHRLKRSSRQAALLIAQEKHAAITNGHTARLRITEAQAWEYERACQEIAPTGKTILTVAIEARAHWEQQQKLTGPQGAKVADLVQKFLAAKAAEGIGDYYQRDLKARLERFAGDFQLPLAEVNAETLAAWLDSLKIGPRTWNNYLDAIKALTGWCRKRRLIDADWRGDELDPRKLAWQRPQIYTPAELRDLLETASPNLSRSIALTAFAGLRTEEVAGIRWQDFKWTEGYIHVDESIAKTRQHSPPILDCLRAWIGTIEQTGKFCGYKNAKSLSGMKVALNERLGFGSHRNSLRKSWISYRLAILQNEAQVADEAGTDVGDIHRHYLNRPSAAEAQKWFGIRPNSVTQNVIQLGFASIY